jgi:hypothetical protein
VERQETQNFIGGVARKIILCRFSIPFFSERHSRAILARFEPAILARIESDRLYFELRTIAADEQKTITTTLLTILRKAEP